MNQPHANAPSPWYREPWPWILMSGPLIALVACAITIYLAMERYVDPPITEGASREGLVVRRLPVPVPVPVPVHGPAAAANTGPHSEATGS